MFLLCRSVSTSRPGHMEEKYTHRREIRIWPLEDRRLLERRIRLLELRIWQLQLWRRHVACRCHGRRRRTRWRHAATSAGSDTRGRRRWDTSSRHECRRCWRSSSRRRRCETWRRRNTGRHEGRREWRAHAGQRRAHCVCVLMQNIASPDYTNHISPKRVPLPCRLCICRSHLP